ncbi:efflux RND transporter periplasmic adaptor subunit, partial [bacterium]|nr:efflux RND transporter periplasmic adaptor subunit [bacterium]
MKKLSIIVFIFLFTVLWTGWGHWPDNGLNRSFMSRLTVKEAAAAEKGLKAGMIHPDTGKKIKYWVAPMDPTYISKEPGKSPMGMDLVPVYDEQGEDKDPASVIRIDPVTMQNMGVRLARVERKPLIKNIRTYGSITYDERKIYTVNTKFNGWIEKLYVDFVGDKVKKGQPLFDIYSPELVTAQEEYLLAVEQCGSLCGSPYPSIREGAKRLIEASRTRLRYWDLTDEQIKRIESTGKIRKTLTIYSPASGVIIEKDAFEGHYVKLGEHQFVIADLSIIWVDVDIYEYELPWIRRGMSAHMDLSYIPGKRFMGKVLYVYPFLEEKTRTAKLRLEFKNPGYKLKPGMYANIYLKSVISKSSLVIPQEAIIDSGVRKVVFVSLGKGKFQPREVRIGVEGNENEFQVLEGLKEGEKIVISAQFMLDSESRLREAIQKMLKVSDRGPETKKEPSREMQMEGVEAKHPTKTPGAHQHQ